MNRVERLHRDAPDAAAFARGYLRLLAGIFEELDSEAIAAFAHELLAARGRGGRIFFMGNGGSAATASHFVNDLAIGSKNWDPPFRAISLVDNPAVLTAVGNDYGYEEIFIGQLRGHLSRDDLVVAISVSGNSPNVVRAVEYAKAESVRTVGLTGFDGGTLRELADIVVHAPTEQSEYGPAEDVHMVLNHLVSAYVQLVCASA